MSVWNYLFDNDLLQRLEIESMKEDMARLRSDGARRAASDRTDLQLERLRDEVAELALFNKALLRLLIEKGACTAQEFAETLHEVDAEDGVVDGKLTPKCEVGVTFACAECDRPVARARPRCVFCGHTNAV